MRTFLFFIVLFAFAINPPIVDARPQSPFVITAARVTTNNLELVRVQISVPPDHLVYADHLHVETLDGDTIVPTAMSTATVLTDKVTGKAREMFSQPFHLDLGMAQIVNNHFLIKLQGCSNSACYFPEKHYFEITKNGGCLEISNPTETEDGNSVASEDSNDWQSLASRFKVVSQKTGFIPAREFAGYLHDARMGRANTNGDPLGNFNRFGLIATVFLILFGGLGLNLTPCVLPLIPINLAIIGAGRAAQSKREGFAHGAAYGLGMSLAYGVLGLAVVLTGAKFGTLNSSIWFNVVIAVIFAALSLAMFDVFHIDFTRFDRGLSRQNTPASGRKKSAWMVAFTLGAIAALLAGACVAPVVISVLLLAANLYAKGLILGLLLPFILGLGMAMPWPFMGASLSFLPKPGKWMVWVKRAFGVAILIFAGYYGWLAYGLAQSGKSKTIVATAPGGVQPPNNTNLAFTHALREALSEKKPLFIDFKASWCKNCEAMDAMVFNQTSVQKQLSDFVVVKYEAERPGESPAKDVLDHFGIIGLPAYLVLIPVN